MPNLVQVSTLRTFFCTHFQNHFPFIKNLIPNVEILDLSVHMIPNAITYSLNLVHLPYTPWASLIPNFTVHLCSKMKKAFHRFFFIIRRPFIRLYLHIETVPTWRYKIPSTNLLLMERFPTPNSPFFPWPKIKKTFKIRCQFTGFLLTYRNVSILNA